MCLSASGFSKVSVKVAEKHAANSMIMALLRGDPPGGNQPDVNQMVLP